LLLQQLLQVSIAPPQSIPIPSNKRRKKEHDSEDDPRTEENIAAWYQQPNIKRSE
jgi:hypothetical protein